MSKAALPETPAPTPETKLPNTAPRQSPHFELESALAARGVILPRGLVDDLSMSAREMLSKWLHDSEYSLPSIVIPYIDSTVIDQFYRLQTPDDCVSDTIDALEVFLEEVSEPELIDSMLDPLYEFYGALHKTDGFNASVDRFGEWFDQVYQASNSDDSFPPMPASLKTIVDRAMKSWVPSVDASQATDSQDNEAVSEPPSLPALAMETLDAATDAAMAIVDESLPAQQPATPRQQAIDRLHLDLHRAQRELINALADLDIAKAEAKNAKKAYDIAQSGLNSVVAELSEALSSSSEWQARLQFPEDDVDSQAPESDSLTNESQPTKDPALDASVEQLAITDSLKEKMLDADIATIKELEQVMVEDRLRKVKGVGDTAIDKISDAVIAWRNEYGYGPEGE